MRNSKLIRMDKKVKKEEGKLSLKIVKKLEDQLYGEWIPDKSLKRYETNQWLLAVWKRAQEQEFKGKFAQGALLYIWEKTGYYTQLGYEDFKDFCNGNELGVSYSYATRIKNVFEFFVMQMGYDEEELAKRIGSWSRLSKLLPAAQEGKITKTNVEEVLDQVSGQRFEDVDITSRELRGKIENDAGNCNHDALRIIKCPRCLSFFKPQLLEMEDGRRVRAFVIDDLPGSKKPKKGKK